MSTVKRFPYFRKLVASMLVLLALQGGMLSSGMQFVDSAYAADVCDGTCG